MFKKFLEKLLGKDMSKLSEEELNLLEEREHLETIPQKYRWEYMRAHAEYRIVYHGDIDSERWYPEVRDLGESEFERLYKYNASSTEEMARKTIENEKTKRKHDLEKIMSRQTKFIKVE